MSAARNRRIKATQPLEPYNGPGTAPDKHDTFEAHQAWQAKRWKGRLVAFDHAELGRCLGRCASAKPLGRDGRGIPDYFLTVESLTAANKRVSVNLVAARGEFYATEDEAKEDALLRLEREEEAKQ